MRKRKAITLIPALKISPSEHSEQVGFINWFRSQYPEILIFAIPNGEKRSISVAKRLKDGGSSSRCSRSIYTSLEFVD